jgi:hypothetical protein
MMAQPAWLANSRARFETPEKAGAAAAQQA